MAGPDNADRVPASVPEAGQTASEPQRSAPPSLTDRKPRRLGRGLASLISATAAAGAGHLPAGTAPDHAHPAAPAGPADQPAIRRATTALANVLVASIEPNPFQPRRTFDPDSLAGLAESIKTNGLVQPILVRRHRDGDSPDGRFQLIAGERRWRAARLAGLESLPAIVKTVDDDAALELALVENIQRADLNPIERALAYQAMMASRSLTQEALARRLGENRTSVTNHLRLLDLPQDVKDCVAAGSLGFGHARALLALREPASQSLLAGRVIDHGWSVRRIEKFIAELLTGPAGEGRLAEALELEQAGQSGHQQQGQGQGQDQGQHGQQGQQGQQAVASPARGDSAKPANIVSLEEKLARRLGTRVSIRQGRRPDLGKVVIDFYCLDDFDRILEALGIVAD